MMASKFLYDEGIDDEVFNDEWAASADMENEDVNELEREFLSAIVSSNIFVLFSNLNIDTRIGTSFWFNPFNTELLHWTLPFIVLSLIS